MVIGRTHGYRTTNKPHRMNRKDFIRNTLIAIAASLLPKTLQPQEIELSNRPQASDYNIYVRKEVNGVEITCVDNLFFSVDPKHY